MQSEVVNVDGEADEGQVLDEDPSLPVVKLSPSSIVHYPASLHHFHPLLRSVLRRAVVRHELESVVVELEEGDHDRDLTSRVDPIFEPWGVVL
jgi:hypothetical protein